MTEQETIEFLQNLNVKLTDMSGHKTNGIEQIFGWNEISAICEAIKVLEEIQQYRAIGTPEECREAVEKHIPKKITHQGCFDNKGVWHTWNGINGVPYDLCPNCETNLCTDGLFGRDKKIMKYCENCGQKLDWSDNNEKL